MQRKDVHERLEIYCDYKNNTCPIIKEKCKKINRCKFGVCAFEFKGEYQILCPNMFLKSNFINDINDLFLRSSKLVVLKEVKYLNNYFDFILLDEGSYDYVIVETQALDSCGNFLSLLGEKVKPFSINWKTTIKTSIYQLIMKAYIADYFDKKLIFVCQNTLTDYMKISDKQNQFDNKNKIFIFTYSYNKGLFQKSHIYSFSLKSLIDLYKGMSNFTEDLDSIIKKRLKNRFNMDNN